MENVLLLIYPTLGGRRHSCPAGHRHYRGADPGFSRTKTRVSIPGCFLAIFDESIKEGDLK